MNRLFPFLLLFTLLSCREATTTKPSAQQMIDGAWIPVTADLGGQPMPENVRKTIKLSVADGRYKVTVGDQPDAGIIKLDPSAQPMALDIVGTEGPNKGKTIPAIFDLAGDTLKVCYDLSGQTRPTEFKSSAGTQQFLVTYQREKK
jgi:uncharacterized protein (TIGR03067 family)